MAFVREIIPATSLTTNGNEISATTSGAVVAGDILVFALGMTGFNSASLGTPTGTAGVGTFVTRIDGSANSTNRMGCWSAPVTTSGAKTVTSHTLNPSLLQAHLIVVAGATGMDVSVASFGSAATTMPAGTLTTTTDDDLLVAVWLSRQSSGAWTGLTAGMTQLAATTSGSFYYLRTASGTAGAAGSTGTKSATFSVANFYNAGMIAFTPAATASGLVVDNARAATRATKPLLSAPFVRPYYGAADWMWDPIPASPVLDAESSSWTAMLGEAGTSHICNIFDYAVTLRGPAGIDGSTPRYDIAFAMQPEWGPDPFGSETMPIPNGIPVPGEDAVGADPDGHVSVADPVSGETFNLWQAVRNVGPPVTWSASWGAMCPLDGDGIEHGTGGSTASRLARFGAVIRASEIAAGEIRHALFFSTDSARPVEYRYPAISTDGGKIVGSTTTIPQGARVQLDPSIDVEVIPGITDVEVTIAKALQTYGAYCGDSGGARMAFLFELTDDAVNGDNPGAVYTAAGLGWDYFDLTHIPWSSVRTLATWDGSAAATELIIGPARSTATASRPLLAQHETITIRAARAASQAGSPLLTQASALAVHAARADATASRSLLTQRSVLTVRAARATTAAAAPLLAQHAALVVTSARAAAAATSPTLGQSLGQLVVRDVRADARATAPLLAQRGALNIVSARSASRATSPTLTQRSVLAVDDARAGSTADAPTLSATSGIIVDSARSETTVSRPLLTAPGILVVHGARAATGATSPLLAQHHAPLDVDDARATATASRPLLVQRTTLAVLNARAEAYAQRVLLGGVPALPVRNPTSVQLTEAYGLAVAELAFGEVSHTAEVATVQVEVEGRIYLTPAYGAVLHTAEPTTVQVEAEGFVNLVPAHGAVLITP